MNTSLSQCETGGSACLVAPAKRSAPRNKHFHIGVFSEETANVNITLEMPGELARRLEGIAAIQHMGIRQFAL